MRSVRDRIVLVALAIVVSTAGARAAEPEAAEGEEAPPPAEPTPHLAGAPPAAAAASGAAGWHEGFMLLPHVGVNSFQGDGAENVGPGLRLGLLAGSRMTELLSLNVGFAFDLVNLDVPTGASANEFMVDIGFNPLLHFPLEKLELLVGPILGTFFMKGSAEISNVAVDTWAYGWTIGANAGLMFAVTEKVKLGGLINFHFRKPLKFCVTANGMDTCPDDDLDAAKAIAVTFAALL